MFFNQITLSRAKAAYRIEDEIEKLSNNQINDRISSYSEWTRLDFIKSWINATLRYFRNPTSSSYIQPTINSSKREIEIAQFVTSAPYNFLIFLLVVLPFIIVGLAIFYSIPYYGRGCTGCFLPTQVIIFFIVAACILLVVGLAVSCKLRMESDPFYFLHEFVLNWIGAGFGGISCLIGLLFFSDLMYELLIFNWEFLVLIGLCFQHFVSCPLIIILAWRSHRTKIREIRRNSILPELHLKTILNNPDLRELFSRHLESEFNIDQFKFLIVVDLWQASYSENDGTAQMRARMIHDNFTSHHALFPINIPSSMRDKICDEFDKDANQHHISQTIFNDAQNEISKMLAMDSLQRFLKSKLYTNHINSQDSKKMSQLVSTNVSMKESTNV